MPPSAVEYALSGSLRLCLSVIMMTAEKLFVSRFSGIAFLVMKISPERYFSSHNEMSQEGSVHITVFIPSVSSSATALSDETSEESLVSFQRGIVLCCVYFSSYRVIIFLGRRLFEINCELLLSVAVLLGMKR